MGLLKERTAELSEQSNMQEQQLQMQEQYFHSKLTELQSVKWVTNKWYVINSKMAEYCQKEEEIRPHGIFLGTKNFSHVLYRIPCIHACMSFMHRLTDFHLLVNFSHVQEWTGWNESITRCLGQPYHPPELSHTAAPEGEQSTQRR